MWSSMLGPDDAELVAALRDAVPVDRPGPAGTTRTSGTPVLGQVIATV
jgi:hypothetical protein